MNTVALLPEAPADLPGPRVSSVEQAAELGYALVLGKHERRLSLWAPAGRELPLAVDFDGGRLGYRLERVNHEMLVRALGGPGNAEKPVVDATAGLGRDAVLMAMAGYPVTLIERQPLIHALLADGLARLPARLAMAPLTLQQADSVAWLHANPNSCFAVSLDPMFPNREKSAAVKKDLRWLQLIGEQPLDMQDESALLDAALHAAIKKVVVKRPLRAPPLAGRAPSHSLKGKAVRFDVYASVCL